MGCVVWCKSGCGVHARLIVSLSCCCSQILFEAFLLGMHVVSPHDLFVGGRPMPCYSTRVLFAVEIPVEAMLPAMVMLARLCTYNIC
jgi:uncharacterized membrane protein YqgA involved in biofilm formation